jgi:perosamine synthetase
MNKEYRKLNYSRQSIDPTDISAVAQQLSSDWLTQGPAVSQFENLLCDITGARYAVAVSSGTAALHIAAIAAGLSPGSSGITSAITFAASANCMAYTGAHPFFCDVEPETGLINTDDLQRRCRHLKEMGTPPRVIIPVDFAGQPADLPRIFQIAGDYDALVIEDAAHSLGASYTLDGHTYRCGSCSHSHMAILSFHPVKHITTGEGGAVLTNDPDLSQKLRDLRSHGIIKDPARMSRNDGPWYYEQQILGFNYRLTDIQCALGISQTKRLKEFVDRRRSLAARYDSALMNPRFSSTFTPLHQRSGTRNSYHLYVIRMVYGREQNQELLAEARLNLYRFLESRKIHAQVHYIPVPQQPWYRKNMGANPEDFPGASAYYASCLSLPLYPGLEESDVDRVVESLRLWMDRKS